MGKQGFVRVQVLSTESVRRRRQGMCGIEYCDVHWRLA